MGWISISVLYYFSLRVVDTLRGVLDLRLAYSFVIYTNLSSLVIRTLCDFPFIYFILLVSHTVCGIVGFMSVRMFRMAMDNKGGRVIVVTNPCKSWSLILLYLKYETQNWAVESWSRLHITPPLPHYHVSHRQSNQQITEVDSSIQFLEILKWSNCLFNID